MGREVELLDGLKDSGARLFRDAPVAAQNIGDGARGHSGMLRDVTYGRAPRLSLRPRRFGLSGTRHPTFFALTAYRSQVSHCRRSHSLVEPARIPVTRARWANRKTIRTGATATKAARASSGRKMLRSLPPSVGLNEGVFSSKYC